MSAAKTASPDLVALANELAAGVERFCNTPGDGPNAITRANDKIWKKIEAFAPRSVADVLAKARAGAIYYGEGIPKEGEEMYASDRIALQMIADLEHLLSISPGKEARHEPNRRPRRVLRARPDGAT